MVLESDVEGDETFTEAVKLSLRSLVRRKLGEVAIPDEIQVRIRKLISNVMKLYCIYCNFFICLSQSGQ